MTLDFPHLIASGTHYEVGLNMVCTGIYIFYINFSKTIFSSSFLIRVKRSNNALNITLVHLKDLKVLFYHI